jgi:tripartite-type tricarboxylate transporter receptor subunit TctC
MRSFSVKLAMLLCVAFVFGILNVCVGNAQEIKGPIRIIVPYPAGGGSDVLARLIADKMKDSLKTTVIVENKPGAGGRIGTEYAKGQPADGSSMLFVNPALFVVGPMVYSKLPYDPDKDFKPLSAINTYEFVLAIPASSPIKDVKGLIEWMKKNPKEANYGSPAAGSLPHFFGLMISKYAGVEMVHVPYAGSAPLLTALIGAQIPMAVDVFDNYFPHHPDKIRILATAGSSRKHPDIPTFKDLGYKDIQGVGWNGIVVPFQTPAPIIEKLNQAAVKAVKMPDVTQKIQQMGSDVTGTTPEEFGKILKQDRENWGPIIKASGFKAD